MPFLSTLFHSNLPFSLLFSSSSHFFIVVLISFCIYLISVIKLVLILRFLLFVVFYRFPSYCYLSLPYCFLIFIRQRFFSLHLHFLLPLYVSHMNSACFEDYRNIPLSAEIGPYFNFIGVINKIGFSI